MELGYCPQIVFRAYDDNGKPLSGGLVETFYAGSSIPEPTYKDFSGSPWSTSFNLNASGEARILLDKSKAYKFIISNADGSNPQVYDNISITEGVLEVGGGTLNLQQVTDNGNTTTNGMEIGGQLKLGTQQINNAPTKVLGIDTLGNVVETDPSVFLSTTAGILDRIFFTGDTQTLTSGTYYKTSGTSKGTVPLVTQTVSPNDNEKLYFAQDLISEQVTGAPKNFPKGAYSGQLSVLGTSISAGQQQKFTIEVYAADSNGVPYNSGLSGAPIGDLGFQVISILDSGNVTLASGEESLVLVSGFLNDDYSLAIGSRVRLHVSGEKIGIIGGAINLSVFYGQNANSYLDVPASITSNMVENLSTVTGANVTNALDWLKTNKEPTIASGTSAQYWDGNKTWQDFSGTTRSVTLGGSYTPVNSAIINSDNIVQAFGKTQGQINALGTSLGNCIAKDGSTTTTATIPFAVGVSVTGANADGSAIRIPNNTWIRPQTAQGGLFLTNGANPTVSNGVLHITTNYNALVSGDGTNAYARLELTDNQALLVATSASGVYNGRLTLGRGAFDLSTDNGAGARLIGTGGNLFIQAGSSSTSISFADVGSLSYSSTTNHIWDGGIAGSTAKYQFGGGDSAINGKHYFYATTTNVGWVGWDSGALSLASPTYPVSLSSGGNLTLKAAPSTHIALGWGLSATPPTGTQAYLLAVDASGNIIQGTASGGGIATSGHTQITTPWSIGDAATFNASNYGYYIDNAYGNYIKGQTIIEQATSSGLILYRPVTSGDICLEYDAWDSVGTRVPYAQVCGRVVSTAVGSQTGAIALEAYTAGVKSDIAVFQSSGIQFNSALSGTSATFSGGITSIRSNDLGDIYLNSPAGLPRWCFYKSGVESGSDSGSDLYLVNYRDDGSYLNTVLTITRAGGGSITLGRPTVLSNQALAYSGSSGAPSYSFSSQPSLGFWLNGSVITLQGALTTTGRAILPTVTATATGEPLNLGSGATTTSPSTLNAGAVWMNATDGLCYVSATAKRIVADLGSAQTFSGAKTFSAAITANNTVTARQLAQTRQTSATTTGAITWTLSSGGTMDLTAALTGAVTMNITAPAAGAWSALFVTQGATPQTVTLSLTGVSWISTGPNGTTGTNTITIPAADFIANKSSCVQIYWSTATRAYVTVT